MKNFLPTESDVEMFEMLFPMLKGNLFEVRELSKKKQDEPLNRFKVETINEKLKLVKEILNNEPTFCFLKMLNDETLPSNSDAIFTISEYIHAMTHFKEKYYTKDSNDFDIIETYSWKTIKG